jgi:4'-phosphopantetheinyl transferase
VQWRHRSSPAVQAAAASLSDPERQRAAAALRPIDRDRLLFGAAALRVAVAGLTGCAPQSIDVDRTCARCGAQHGRPLVVGANGWGLEVSVSYAGDYVVVAVTSGGRVGVDAERAGGRFPAGLFMAESERYRDRDLAVYWTRKESVVKATGGGILVDLRRVRVGSANRPPRLVSYPGGAMPAYMTDLEAPPGYRAALTVLVDEKPAPMRL